MKSHAHQKISYLKSKQTLEHESSESSQFVLITCNLIIETSNQIDLFLFSKLQHQGVFQFFRLRILIGPLAGLQVTSWSQIFEPGVKNPIDSRLPVPLRTFRLNLICLFVWQLKYSKTQLLCETQKIPKSFGKKPPQ